MNVVWSGKCPSPGGKEVHCKQDIDQRGGGGGAKKDWEEGKGLFIGVSAK
jgi:hypothetical protein